MLAIAVGLLSAACETEVLTRLRGFDLLKKIIRLQVVASGIFFNQRPQAIGVPFEKSTVVKTYPVPRPAILCIIRRHYVSALHDAKEKWQGTPLLERRRKQTLRRP